MPFYLYRYWNCIINAAKAMQGHAIFISLEAEYSEKSHKAPSSVNIINKQYLKYHKLL